MQKLLACGALLDLVADVVAACTATSGLARTDSLLMATVPAALGLASLVSRATPSADAAEFRAGPIRR